MKNLFGVQNRFIVEQQQQHTIIEKLAIFDVNLMQDQKSNKMKYL